MILFCNIAQALLHGLEVAYKDKDQVGVPGELPAPSVLQVLMPWHKPILQGCPTAILTDVSTFCTCFKYAGVDSPARADRIQISIL